MINRQSALHILNTTFGYECFRPLQAEIIAATLAGKDSLVVMPTGGGKSVCYQIPALIFDGLTVVVSPLISLMKDQVDQLTQLGIEAVLLNSSISRDEYTHGIHLVQSGTAKLLYLAPETLLKNDILSLLSSVQVQCIAIDEAHCISEWGHDFRPEYRKIAEVRRRFPSAACMALTATATERVRDDICRSLDFKESSRYVASFNRDNLLYRIVPKNNPLQQTLDFLSTHNNESGIIYTFSRDNVDAIYASLEKHGYSVKPYHAGLPDNERAKNQELFLKDEVQIIVATIAFGMGIHKTNVRFVLHFDLPKSVESYYQETGRAGRDGVQSECLLLYSYSDIHKIKYFIDQKTDETEKQTAVTQLNALVSYADSENCRRVSLIRYFGEDYTVENCGMCDNCLSAESAYEDVTIPAQKFLSCVKRTGETFGAGHIIDVLRGSHSKKVESFGHSKLSTYGIGTDFSKERWQQLSRKFIQQGLLVQNMEGFGELKITAKGYSVLKGELTVSVKIETVPHAKKSYAGGNEYDHELFELLRTKRKELAALENVPPYIIFSDKTLMEIADSYPQTSAALMNIHGIGSHKIEKYGELVLSIVQKYCSGKGIEPDTAEVPAPREYLKTPRHIVIGELFNSGCSIEDIEKDEKIKRTTVILNLETYIQDGFSIRKEGLIPFLPADKMLLDQIMNAFERAGTEFLKPAFDALDGSVDYNTLKICRMYYLCCRNFL